MRKTTTNPMNVRTVRITPNKGKPDYLTEGGTTPDRHSAIRYQSDQAAEKAIETHLSANPTLTANNYEILIFRERQ